MPKALAFFRGEIVPVSEAKVGIMTHALHYGTTVFEGVRGNWNNKQSKLFIFRLKEHYERMLRGCSILMVTIPYSVEDLIQITVDLIENSGYTEDLYIRPIAYKSEEAVANLMLNTLESDFALMALPFGSYIKAEGAIKCKTSSWRRPDDTMIPTGVKLTGLYTTSILAKTEAVVAGYDEAILLNHDGTVSEGSGENLFMVRDNRIYTPSETDNCLMGITRDSVIQLIRNELGLDVVERRIHRSELYLADEIFLTGTAAHVTPVGYLDDRPIANGETGSTTGSIQKIYQRIIRGDYEKYLDWCTSVALKS